MPVGIDFTSPAEELQIVMERRLNELEAKLSIIEVEADSLEKASEKIHARMPVGSVVVSTKEIPGGEPKTITATGKTLKKALKKGRTQVPEGARMVREAELTSPGKRANIIVEAFDETEATAKAQRTAKHGEKVQQYRVLEAGKRGFLRLGRKPARYEISLLSQIAKVELVFKTPAYVRATIGASELVEEIIWLRRELARLRAQAEVRNILDTTDAEAELKSGTPESRGSSSPIGS